MRYLFWNTGRNQVNSELQDLIEDLSCDVVGLAEYKDNMNQLVSSLKTSGFEYDYVDKIGCDRIDILSKITSGQVTPLNESSYYTIKEFPHDTLGTIIIAFVHLPSKLHNAEDADNLSRGHKLKTDVEEAEQSCGHTRTVIVGDFNMNPFEQGMVAAMALHSVSCQRIAQANTRRVSGDEYSMFYNPMWNLMGDEVKPPGTYFYNNTGQVNYFWNIFDQVIIRPELVRSYVPGSVKIVTEAKSKKLVDHLGRPCISDHLPIIIDIV